MELQEPAQHVLHHTYGPLESPQMCRGLVMEGLISLKRMLGVGRAILTLKDFLGYSCHLIGFNPNVVEVILKPRSIASFTLYMSIEMLVL